ncbi:hypothetical protein [Priestia megaterium]|uniref:hypothetical protein n=1 Tax=Priestia megaterium TaxID=1404 RepID=UPI002FFDFDA3
MRKCFELVAVCALAAAFYGLVKDIRFLLGGVAISIIFLPLAPNSKYKRILVVLLIILLVFLALMVIFIWIMSRDGGFGGKDCCS